MGARIDRAQATRRSLLTAARRLLDDGGVDAVTLRAVGADAGVSRGAAYGHFDDKAHLLTVLAAEGWDELSAQLETIRDDPGSSPADRLRHAARAMVALAGGHPKLYELMFTQPESHVEVLLGAAGCTQDLFLGLVAEATRAPDPRATGALLLAGVHGIGGMAAAGHLGTPKWGVTADGLIDLLVDQVVAAG